MIEKESSVLNCASRFLKKTKTGAKINMAPVFVFCDYL